MKKTVKFLSEKDCEECGETFPKFHEMIKTEYHGVMCEECFDDLACEGCGEVDEGGCFTCKMD